MSAPMAVDDVIQVTYEGEIADQTILIVLHCRVQAAPGGSSAEVELNDIAQTLADPLTNQFLTQMLAASSNEYFIRSVKAQKIKPTRTIYQEAPIALSGADANPISAQNLAISIEKQSTKVGRKGVGRLQFAGASTASYTNGEVDFTYLNTVIKPMGLTLVGTFPGTAFPTGIYRWCLPAGGADHDYDVYDMIPKATVRTMHRRTLRLGI